MTPTRRFLQRALPVVVTGLSLGWVALNFDMRAVGQALTPRVFAILLPALLLLLSAQPGLSQEVNYSVECDAFATASLESLGTIVGDPENIRDSSEATALLFVGSSGPSGAFWRGEAKIELIISRYMWSAAGIAAGTTAVASAIPIGGAAVGVSLELFLMFKHHAQMTFVKK